MTEIRSRTVDVLGSRMHYRETGGGNPVVLLHGNPTSSWLWRHVLHHGAAAAPGTRWIAPDLIGMGASATPDLPCSLADHIAHVDGFVEALGLDDVVLVGHDWGVAIAMDHLRRHPAKVRGIALMEGHLRPLPGWEAFDDGGRDLFQRLRTPGVGEQVVLEEDFFLKTLLPAALVRPLDSEELSVYRTPYPDAASRRPLLAWARQIPIAGEPAAAAQTVQLAVEHLQETEVPVLLVHGQPGVLVGEAVLAWCREHIRSLEVVDVGGPAGHFLPEDRPEQVAQALAGWVGALPR